MRYRWLIGGAALALGACGGVVRTTPGGDAGSATGGATSAAGHSSQGGTPSQGGTQPMTAGQVNTGGQIVMPVPCGKTLCPEFCCDAVCGICGTADGACPDIACVDPGETCRGGNPPVVLGCAQRGGVPTGPTDSAQVNVPSGVVVSEVNGSQGGCLEPLLKGQPNWPELLAQVMSFTVNGGNNDFWNVEVIVGGSRLPSLLGQKVRLTYEYKFGGFGPTFRQLSLVSLQSPSLGVWTAEGGALPELNNLPLLRTQGAVDCSANEPCGSYDRFSIVVTDPLTMGSVDVPYAQTRRLGPWEIVHAGYERQSSPSMCPDWFVAHALVGVVGLM